MEYEKMLSVAILTYNHAEFIEEAIKSVLMQETTYDYEILIADDYSTDGTREIIKKYKEMYPDKIRLILQEKNVGAVKNQVTLLGSCKGKYIAILDGDDYWINPKKIQIQVDFLEEHEDYSGCYGDADAVGADFNFCSGDLDGYEYFLNETAVFATGSFVLRNYFLNTDNFKYYHYTKVITDRMTICIALKHGKIGHIREKVSVYRIRTQGNSYTAQSYYAKFVDYLDSLRAQYEIVPDDAKKYVNLARLRTAKSILKKAREERNFSMWLKVFFNKITFKERIKILTTRNIKIIFP